MPTTTTPALAVCIWTFENDPRFDPTVYYQDIRAKVDSAAAAVGAAVTTHSFPDTPVTATALAAAGCQAVLVRPPARAVRRHLLTSCPCPVTMIP
jgi:hypothetical protein